MVIFRTSFFLGNIGLENVFYDILERRNAFQGYKNKKFKKLKKIDIFPKGLTQGLNPQMVISPIFFLANIGQENVFYDILEKRNAFQGYKNKKFKKSKKIDIFPKGLTQGLIPKMAIFPFFF